MYPFIQPSSPSPRTIGRRDACRLIATAGAAAVWSSLPRRAFAQRATIRVSGQSVPALRELDELLFDYLRRNPSVPAASLAIAREGRVIYARAFGWASVEDHAAAQPDSLFRVASVSKTLTAAAILLLVQRGRLKLSEPAFPLLHLEPPPNTRTPADPRLDRITIHQLLCHTGGWARTTADNPFETWKGFDPMFFPVEIARTLEVPSPASPRDIVRFMLTRRLDFDPGTRYAYSNFGYCVLGRVIERVSGVPYGEFVRNELLRPMGIHGPRLGRSLLADRAPREVRYYPSGDKTPTSKNVFGGPDVQWCYGGFELEAMDSHGGWIATASDLVRFAASLDVANASGPLNAESIQQMFARPAETGYAANGVELPAYYADGWHVQSTLPEGSEQWHDGLFGGASALLMRRRDGIVWALVFNTDNDDSRRSPAEVMVPHINRLADSVAKWPA